DRGHGALRFGSDARSVHDRCSPFHSRVSAGGAPAPRRPATRTTEVRERLPIQSPLGQNLTRRRAVGDQELSLRCSWCRREVSTSLTKGELCTRVVCKPLSKGKPEAL